MSHSRRNTAHQRATTGDDDHQWRRRRRQHGEVFVVRQVTAENLVRELSTIRALLETYPYITVHAEHHGGGGDGGGGDEEGSNLPPGVRIDDLPAAARYGLAKVDVDSSLPFSQLGITLCDANGKLPVLPAAAPWPPAAAAAAAAQSVWQVWLHRDSSSATASVSATGVVSPSHTRSTAGAGAGDGVTWVAYGGLYHLGFLLRVLTGGERLPETKEEFLAALRAHLGGRVFDARHVAARASLTGPLTRVAALLGAPAATATAAREPWQWQAGERSLVACQVFMRLKGLFFAWDSIDVHAGCIHGLHSLPTSLFS